MKKILAAFLLIYGIIPTAINSKVMPSLEDVVDNNGCIGLGGTCPLYTYQEQKKTSEEKGRLLTFIAEVN